MELVYASDRFGDREMVTKYAAVSAKVKRIGPATMPPGRVCPCSSSARRTSRSSVYSTNSNSANGPTTHGLVVPGKELFG